MIGSIYRLIFVPLCPHIPITFASRIIEKSSSMCKGKEICFQDNR
nr:MAG TPA: hypothetical protein [Caudoviricetes sp.]